MLVPKPYSAPTRQSTASSHRGVSKDQPQRTLIGRRGRYGDYVRPEPTRDTIRPRRRGATGTCLARHPCLKPTNDLAAGSARVGTDYPIGVSEVKGRLIQAVPPLAVQ